MEKNRKTVIVIDDELLTPDVVDGIMDALMALAGQSCEPEKPTLSDVADRLISLADQAEEYRDALDDFISEADALLELIGQFDEDCDDDYDWDDEE